MDVCLRYAECLKKDASDPKRGAKLEEVFILEWQGVRASVDKSKKPPSEMNLTKLAESVVAAEFAYTVVNQASLEAAVDRRGMPPGQGSAERRRESRAHLQGNLPTHEE